MKCKKNDRHFTLLLFLRYYKNDITTFLFIFSIRISFLNKIPKILDIFLKISGPMENVDSGIDIDKTTVPKNSKLAKSHRTGI